MTQQKEENTVAIVSYITLIGWIVAVVLHGNNKTKLGAFHLRQTLGIFAIGFGLFIVNLIFAFIPVLNIIIGLVIMLASLGLLVFWVLGLVGAVNGEMKPLPLIGEPIQKILKNTFE